MDTPKTEPEQNSEERQYTYMDWLEQAIFTGIDWNNNPPPKEMLTEELCKYSLEDSPGQLPQIPDEFKTFDVCFFAVYQDDDVLQFVPEALRDEVKQKKDAITEDEWINELSRFTGNHYLKLPRRLLTPDFCRKIVSCNGFTIDLIPKELQTPELLQLAGSEREKEEKWDKNISKRVQEGSERRRGRK
jgi:hypothetical protein